MYSWSKWTISFQIWEFWTRMDIFLIRSSGQYFEKFSHQTPFSWLCLTRIEFHAILKIPEKVRCDFYCKQPKLIQSGSLDLNCRGLKLLWHVITYPLKSHGSTFNSIHSLIFIPFNKSQNFFTMNIYDVHLRAIL